MSSTNTSVGTDTILVTHQRAICYAAFSATGKTITSFASIGSEIESKLFGFEENPQHKAFKAETDDGQSLFVKINTTSEARAKLDREVQGLHSMRCTRSLRIPKVVAVTTLPCGPAAALILEYVEMTTMTLDEERKFGTKLARMHIHNGSERFGYSIDTWLATTLQTNDWSDDWCDFFSKHRLGRQADMIREKHDDKELVAKVERLRVGLRERFFEGVDIKPSLLHGNLWTRNWGSDSAGKAVVYDPACYFGHNEMELAMITLFGGPSKGFFVMYHELLPRAEPGYENRMFLYKLYHYLNLYLQFGPGFRGTCMALLNLLLGPSIRGGSSANAGSGSGSGNSSGSGSDSGGA